VHCKSNAGEMCWAAAFTVEHRAMVPDTGQAPKGSRRSLSPKSLRRIACRLRSSVFAALGPSRPHSSAPGVGDAQINL